MELLNSISYLGMIVMWVIAVVTIVKTKDWKGSTKIWWVIASIALFMIAVIALFFKLNKKKHAIISIALLAVYVFSITWKIWGPKIKKSKHNITLVGVKVLGSVFARTSFFLLHHPNPLLYQPPIYNDRY